MSSLESTRLILRPMSLTDVEALHRIWIEPDVRKFLWDDEIISRETAQAVISVSINSFAEHQFGIWTVIYKDTGDIIGCCGFRFIDGTSDIEILYALSQAYWGMGLITEATRAAINYLFDEVGMMKIVGYANPLNVGSYRVLEKLGMHCEGRMQLNGEEVLQYILEYRHA